MEIDRNQKKSIQVMNYFANKTDSKAINRLKVMKLIWIADKFHLLNYGRTITRDNYFALPHGPVPSSTLNLSRNETKEKYISEFLESHALTIKSIKPSETNLFSKSDIEVLDLVWSKFCDLTPKEIRDLSHEYPEWKKFENELSNPLTPFSYEMEIGDFYKIPEPTKKNRADFFNIPKERIFESQQTLQHRIKIGSLI